MSSADERTIIRRGKYMSTVDVSKTSETELATLMVGRNVNLHVEKSQQLLVRLFFSPAPPRQGTSAALSVVNGFNLIFKSGEIVGLAGTATARKNFLPMP